MSSSTCKHASVRVLCLGNELLADDALGQLAAAELERTLPEIESMFCTESGFQLIDYLSGIDLLIVVDTILTGGAPPGTVRVLRHSDMKSAFGPSPHYVGVFETLELAKKLLLKVPQDVIILAVEAADCLTLGGKMHDAVKSAVGVITELVAEIARSWQPAGHPDEGSGDGFREAIATVTSRWGSERLVVG